MRKCKACKVEKKISDFGPDNRNRDGLQGQCRDCRKVYGRKAVLRNGKKCHNYDFRKKCPKCDITKCAGEFFKNKAKKDGISNVCKPCKSTYQSRYNQTIKGKFRTYKTRAKKKGLKFLLSLEDFKKFCLNNCHYCKSQDMNGVDRVNNDQGYLVENCVSCCSMCNQMKLNHSCEKFLDQCKLIVENMQKNK